MINNWYLVMNTGLSLKTDLDRTLALIECNLFVSNIHTSNGSVFSNNNIFNYIKPALGLSLSNFKYPGAK